MKARIAGIILRAPDRHAAARFYGEIGLATREHEHGGPKHYEVGPLSTDCVVEIYKLGEGALAQDALMIEVESIGAVLEVCQRYEIKILSALRETPTMNFIYVADPDGRHVMFIENR